MPAKKRATKSTAKTEVKKPVDRGVPVTVISPFVDGNLGDFFRKYGYDVEWPKGEKRVIPLWLVRRVEQSGGEIEFLAK